MYKTFKRDLLKKLEKVKWYLLALGGAMYAYGLTYALCKHKRICIGIKYITIKVVIIVSLLYVKLHIVCNDL